MEEKKISNSVLIFAVAILFFALGYLGHMLLAQRTDEMIKEIEQEIDKPQERAPLVREGITDLTFSYEEEDFQLEEFETETGLVVYQTTIDEGGANMHGYSFILTRSSYLKEEIEGEETELFILWRGSGANIIEGALFAFQDGEQVDSVKLPEDGGRTSLEKLAFKDGLIVINVKTSGPDKNYHETYVPRTYAYSFNEGKLILQ